MPAPASKVLIRREFLFGTVAAALVLPGAVRAADPADPGVDAVRRLVALAAQNALTGLAQPEGFWNSNIARIRLPVLFRRPPGNAGPLGTDSFRIDLQHRLNNFAESGARAATPFVIAAARKLSFTNSAAVLGGLPTAGASLLRLDMGATLVNAMLDPLEQAFVTAQDPLVTQALTVLPGVTLRDVAHAVALGADNSIWYAIGAAEVAIRQNPEQTNDPVVTAALRAR